VLANRTHQQLESWFSSRTSMTKAQIDRIRQAWLFFCKSDSCSIDSLCFHNLIYSLCVDERYCYDWFWRMLGYWEINPASLPKENPYRPSPGGTTTSPKARPSVAIESNCPKLPSSILCTSVSPQDAHDDQKKNVANCTRHEEEFHNVGNGSTKKLPTKCTCLPRTLENLQSRVHIIQKYISCASELKSNTARVCRMLNRLGSDLQSLSTCLNNVKPYTIGT
jgi:hypothetical protein